MVRGYRIMLDDEMTVVTRVEVELDGARLVADLVDAANAAGLGPPNHVPHSAKTLNN